MFSTAVSWFESQSFQVQLIVLAGVLDPVGFVGGYLLGPAFDLDPVIGGVVGLLVAGIPTTLHVMRRAAEPA